jgi:hypothetical protein
MMAAASASGGGAETDPYWSNVKCLLNFDGDAYDAAAPSRTWTATGSPTYDSNGINLDGSTQWLGTAADATGLALGSGSQAFTIEIIGKLSAVNTLEPALDFRAAPGGFNSYYAGVYSPAGTPRADFIGGGSRHTGGSNAVSASSVEFHLAIMRDTFGTVSSAVNGVFDSTTTGLVSGSMQPTGSGTYWIGRTDDNSFKWSGSIRAIRLTAAVKRWSANFTPPTWPFPES